MDEVGGVVVAGCGHHGCSGGKPDGYLTWPNLVTVVRSVLAAASIVGSLWSGSAVLLYVGLAAYLVGDVADGELARRTGSETRTGAVFDVVADRFCVALFYGAFVYTHHEMLVPVAVFLVNFMLIDTMLSLAFLNWPLLSSNYFYLVDRRLYLLNWSRVGKASNTGLLLVVMIGTGWWVGTLAVAVAQLALKVTSVVLLARLRPPYGGDCARPEAADGRVSA